MFNRIRTENLNSVSLILLKNDYFKIQFFSFLIIYGVIKHIINKFIDFMNNYIILLLI